MSASVRAGVLWITDEPPDRGGGGGNIRQAHLVEAVARRAAVTLLVIGSGTDPQTGAAVAELIEVPGGELRPARRRTVRRLHALWIALPGPREVVITAGRRRLVRARVARLAADAELVVASHLGMAALRSADPRGRWVAQLHHVSSAMAEQEAAVTVGGRQRWLLRREASWARRFERQLVAELDRVVVPSAEDAALLGGGARLLVVPNGVDTERYRPTPLPPEPSIVMTGSFHFQPNVDGAVWFVDDVLPIIRRSVPDATVALVGRQPLAAVEALADRPGVRLHRDVPDMAPFLAAARCTVVPLRIGTGTRLKALESMAAGRTVVGTAIGLGGLDLVDGRDAHVADDAVAMAGAVVRLLTDDPHAAAMAAAGRTLVEAHYRWSVIGDRFADELLGPA
jgi:glycosyltransferase involved in cell wall biosynthesis